MSILFVASGLLCLSSFFTGLMWFQLVKANINYVKSNLLMAKLVLTGFGLVFQSLCLFAIALSRNYQTLVDYNMDVVAAFGMFGLVFSDFLLIIAATLNTKNRTYLIIFIGACLVWFAANSFVYLYLKGII